MQKPQDFVERLRQFRLEKAADILAERFLRGPAIELFATAAPADDRAAEFMDDNIRVIENLNDLVQALLADRSRSPSCRHPPPVNAIVRPAGQKKRCSDHRTRRSHRQGFAGARACER